ncbi:ABC transporter substrate-binding protein [Chlorobium sp. BLA1]|uniref:ABC transporter substrate-binding protein n=1 Tax=Candidatus Chlorobium masyuteum TaxID=2716876 RepID=UPI0014226E2E|nr:ABC transporter substrate-binding protein [Candidatus Chlorobium masyuteum]NHQ61215.1 ABC transporter substrate-binding protein [Candidatus Chlorobium masyuteum]
MRVPDFRKTVVSALLLLMLAGITACKKNDTEALRGERVVTGISADFDYLNPLLIQLSMSREICMLLYPSLAKPSYDKANGAITFLPNTANSWEFSADGQKVTFHLKSSARWEDGKPVTSHDFKYSYALYKRPEIASSRQHYLNDLLLLADGTADIERAVEVPNDSTLVLHFNKPMAPEIILDHFNDLMPVAEHLFKAYSPDEIRSKAAEIPVLSAGPFRVKKWSRQEKLELVTNPSSRLPHPAIIKNLIFLVVPEYTTRLAMLKSGQIDAMISAGGINPKDIRELAKSSPSIAIKPVKNRYFDSIVWLNIDGEAWRNEHKIKPNPLFGDKKVRQALTLAIDRQSIIDGFMGPEHATIINTSLSPAYKSIADTSLDPYAYNPQRATALLREAGWAPGPDGILQKQGRKFSFELAAPVGNPRRNYAATIVQQNLREIGIECRLKFDESLIFLKNQNSFRYEAALSGLAAETLPFQLVIWGSDFVKRPFNSSAFQNGRLDTVIDELSRPLPKEREVALWKEYQKILHEEQPRSFLYYYDELEGFNKRIRNSDVNLISTLYNVYDWSVKP